MFKDNLVRLIGFAIVTTFTVANYKEPETELIRFPCSVDVCNQFGKLQFCSDSQRCINCEDRKGHCWTSLMPKNCSMYCFARMCPLPWSIQNGQIVSSRTSYGRILPGDNLSVACNDGYTLSGDNFFICKEAGQWQPSASMPICEQSYETDWKMVFIITCALLIVVIIVLCVALVYLLTKRKRSDKVPNTSTDEVDEERVPLRTNKENKGTSNNDKIVQPSEDRTLIDHQQDFATGGTKSNRNNTSNGANTVDPINEASNASMRTSDDTTHVKFPVEETANGLEEPRAIPTPAQSGHSIVRNEAEEDTIRKVALDGGTYDRKDFDK